MKHMNLLNAVALFFAQAVGVALSPAATLDFGQRRRARKKARFEKRWRRHASYPYASTRQNARYARQIAAGQLNFA